MTDKIKVHRFTNNNITTPYAPTWDFIIAEKRTDLDVKGLAKIILDGTIDHFFFPGDEKKPLAGSLKFKDKKCWFNICIYLLILIFSRFYLSTCIISLPSICIPLFHF